MNSFNKIALRTILVVFAGSSMLVTSCKKDKGTENPTADKLDPGTGSAGMVLTLTGKDLASMKSIVFEKASVPAAFNPSFNTENAVLFRVPDTAWGGQQNIIFTNTAGKQLSVPFNVLALPNVTDASTFDFEAGTQITLTGVNLDDVTGVVLDGTTTAATIVSKSRKSLVINMPATPLTIAKLRITNTSGTSVTSQEFISLTNNFIVFAEDFGPGAYGIGGIQNWSWDCSAYSASNYAKSGAKSLRVDYAKDGGGLSLFLGCNWATPNLTFIDYYPSPKYLTFWARAEAADASITIVPDNPWYGTDIWGAATATGSKSITVPKGVWTYFKIPANTFTGKYSRLDLKITGGAGTVYYDNILFAK